MSNWVGRVVIGVVVALSLAIGPIGIPVVVPAQSATVTVTLTDRVDPATLTVPTGTTVEWNNQSGTRVRVRSLSGPVEFDSDTLAPGGTFTFTFMLAGTYQYYNHRDPENGNYHGTIVVSTGVPSPTPTPGTGTTPDTSPPPGTGAVGMTGSQFRPPNVTIATGGTVRWVNDDDRRHTVTANDRSFDSGLLNVGQGFSWQFNSPGTFPYRCELHTGMQGTITVTGTATGNPTPAPPAATATPPALPTSSPPPAGATQASITDTGFLPSTIDITTGESVTWRVTGQLPHTVTSRGGLFDSGILRTGQLYTRTFNQPGTFEYLCDLHPEMVGTVTVTGAPVGGPGGGTGTAPPGGETTPGTQPVPSGSVNATIVDSAFVPQSLQVVTGQSVTWQNTGSLPHTVSAADSSFGSGLLRAGERFIWTFNQPGVFSIFCDYHPEMTGTVTVTGVPTTGVGGGSSAGSDSASDNTGADSEPASATASITDSTFEPETIEVARGQAVTWTNVGNLPHTVTAEDGSFNSGVIKRGEAFTLTPDRAGSFAYICELHPEMRGTLIVLDSPARASSGGPRPVTRSGTVAPPRAGNGGTILLIAGVTALAVMLTAGAGAVVAMRQRSAESEP